MVGDAHLIHSVGSLQLAEEISKQAVRLGITVDVLLEVNSGEEEAKGGFLPDEVLGVIPTLKTLPGIRLSGMMTMGPVTDDPEKTRPYFRLTKALFDEAEAACGFEGGGVLSMGMSDSYRVAIEEGSTLVRVGRKIFVKA